MTPQQHPFDPGPVSEPFTALAASYPGMEVYDPQRFRVEWGPIFHRGRLDGNARILVLGQDPGQHESVARRCLVGEAGQRVQGFLAKLGIDHSYVAINAFLYSVYGQPGHGELDELLTKTGPDRQAWLDALLLDSQVTAVVGFGAIARQAYQRWQATPHGAGFTGHFEPLRHPTFPDATARPGTPEYRAAMAAMLAEWSAGLTRLDAALGPERDTPRALVPYGDQLLDTDRAGIPERDLPAGTPPWMRSLKHWANRIGDTPDTKRATIQVTIPTSERPWTASSS
jgi:uracil-DNA glycosylase